MSTQKKRPKPREDGSGSTDGEGGAGELAVLPVWNQTFKDQLRYYRKRDGIKTAEFIKGFNSIGTSEHTIQKIVYGTKAPPPFLVDSFIDKFKLGAVDRERFLEAAALERVWFDSNLRTRLLESVLKLAGRMITRDTARFDHEVRGIARMQAEIDAKDLLLRGPVLVATYSLMPDGRVHLAITNQGLSTARSVVLLAGGPTYMRLDVNIAVGDLIAVTLCMNAERTTDVLAEFRGDKQSLYVQHLVNTHPHEDAERPWRVPIKTRFLERLRTWHDVCVFLAETLGDQTEAPPYFPSGEHASVRVVPDRAVHEILARLRPSDKYAEQFEMHRPVGILGPVWDEFAEVAAMSRTLNGALWSQRDAALVERRALRERLDERLRGQPVAADVLRNKYQSLSTKSRFYNDQKICLGTDVLSLDGPIEIFQGTYYHGFVTNELVTRRVEEREGAEVLYAGSMQPIFVRSGVDYELGDVGEANHEPAPWLSNHIGTSVLLFTTDKRICLWRQDEGEFHLFKDVATGSESCDWADLGGPSATGWSLTDMLKQTMERELREEAGLLAIGEHSVPIEIRLTGYFRWVTRGGKPQFVGLAKARIESSELAPERSEVSKPQGLRSLDAQTLAVLATEIDRYFMDLKNCSLPLWAALKCLRDLCDESPADLSSFLGVPIE